MILLSLGSGEAPLLDIVAYAGYTFTGMCFAVHGKILSGYSYYMGIFLVKTMKRVLFAEMRSFDSSRHHSLLLLIALVQFPFFAWLGNSYEISENFGILADFEVIVFADKLVNPLLFPSTLKSGKVCVVLCVDKM
ncbi:hypothetical protein POTOM_054576 [Populus tomentosa]|uniref:Uncharacterized protein n=1 Tax=Populus tomentosa TaxID=118781 RepID=A0A8X7XVY0_POPTO|nr:hypothetical protein POTOM_054576 [Populus tomentosa]